MERVAKWAAGHPDLPVQMHLAETEPKPVTGIHGNDGLGGVSFPEPLSPPQSDDAISTMIDIINTAAPQTIDLHCLGPLTNLAQLIQRAPETAKRLRRVIAMGGAVDEPGNVGPKAEFNIAHDPHAAAIVFAAGLPMTLIPLDATRQLRADFSYLKALRETQSASAIATADLIAAYFASTNGGESRPLHDPCVPLLAANPTLFTLETRRLDVEIATGALIAGTFHIQVAMGLDAKNLRQVLLEGLSR